MGLSRLFIAISAWLVPSDQRADWRREWLGELHARPAGFAALRFAAGAPVHALWLRLEPWWPGVLSLDLSSGWRFLRRRPGFVVPVVFTLALGIGATTAGFSVVYGVLLKPLPYREPSRVVQLWETNPRFGWTESTIAPGNLLSWRERNTAFSDIAWYSGSDTRSGGQSNLTINGETPARGTALAVSANFFSVLGVQAARGRTFVDGEDTIGRHRVAVLSDAFWRRHFGGNPAVVGQAIQLNGVTAAVIGVMPPTFRFDRADTEFWIPLPLNWSELREVRRPHWLRAIARLKPRVTVEDARAELSKIASDLEREYPKTNTVMGAGLGPLDDWFVGPSRRPLLLLFGAMGLLLLSACANVANLLLARTRERVREMSLRAALGANRLRLTRQLLFETLLVTGTGTALGLGLAVIGVRALLSAAPPGLPRQHEIGFDPVVWMFAAGVGVVTAIAVGVLPAIRAARGDLRAVMADGARGTSLEGRRLHRVFAAVQIALAAVLLGSATLTVRSLHALTRVDPGFSMDGLVTANIALNGQRYSKDAASAAFYDELTERLRAVPGVLGAGATAKLPLDGSSWTSQYYLESRPEFKGSELRHKSVTPGYLEAIGHRVLAGRTIDATDRADLPPVIVINETAARTWFGETNPIGQRVALDPPTPNVRWRTVVGVVSDERQDGLGVPVRPEVFESNSQETFSDMGIAVRSSRPTDHVLGEVRRIVREIDPQVAVFNAGPFAERVERSTVRERVAAWLVVVFAAVGLVLSGVGTYSIAARAVAARTREIGVRVACGATAAEVFRLILRDHLRVAAIGLAVGVPLVLLTAQAMVAVLYGVGATDPISIAASVAIPLIVAGIASAAPARRAFRMNPVTALRSDT
jgi:putative ABC transport system permease protein